MSLTLLCLRLRGRVFRLDFGRSWSLSERTSMEYRPRMDSLPESSHDSHVASFYAGLDCDERGLQRVADTDAGQNAITDLLGYT